MEPTRPPAHLLDASFEVSGASRPRPVDIYRAPGVRITNEAFIVAGRKFSLSELTHLQTARGPHDRLTLRAVLVTAAVLVGIGVALGYTGDLYRLPASTYAGLGLAAFVPVGLALAGNRWRPPAYELWGRYRGEMVLLFSSDHERQFGHVTRSLIRAREAARLGGLAYPPASDTPYEPMS
ncbi:DUF6232 family protein [Micromonospora sp. WMMD1102]|uniref:DUF6232 family protein n=1 Tax=Micromonospora sp. WMMD1102 TaxID=3016105 RepID=UPI00241550A3|nr:DUF6232 family protein [Micromonospora sp. WMMD1102]MDG4789488.1 DUF6232 family protein [Micromonospora sp. WMMD1102]